MDKNIIEEVYELLELVKVTKKNKDTVQEIRQSLIDRDFNQALKLLKEIIPENKVKQIEEKYDKKEAEEKENKKKRKKEKEEEVQEGLYPKKLENIELEKIYIGLLLTNPNAISMYYFLHEDCLFEDEKILNAYKSVLFTEGQASASEIAKKDFNFPKETKDDYEIKAQFRKNVANTNYDFEKVYTELKKLFVLRKHYLQIPIKEMKDKIVAIRDYKLYDKMTVEEVENAVNQVIVTGKFKQSVLNEDVTSFLVKGDNNLTNGLELPFRILSSVFKGIRKGETMAYAMPSNAGKSRFTVNLAAHIAFVKKQKVLIISNEMSEEKMKLCLITTIINNPEIQKLHGQQLHVTEGQLLELKFRADSKSKVKTDKNGFIIRDEKETQKEYIKKLQENSEEFNMVTKATDWLNKEMKNAIYFVNITDHTNEELQKVIMNYYYKEQIEYVFYDTMKTDTANIGKGEELKRTATILSNLAQNFGMFIGATMQLSETDTLPINLDINDLAVSRTVKEVLDTLCLVKQIHNENLGDYEYSLEEVDTKFFDLKREKDPDFRYYACVVDKNRAGAKPRVLFKLNLAYNRWEELGYLRLKQTKKSK